MSAIVQEIMPEEVRERFIREREEILGNHKIEAIRWNEAVARLIREFPKYTGREKDRYAIVATALESLDEPLRSDMILRCNTPFIRSPHSGIKGSLRAFGASYLPNNIWFMDDWVDFPKFPYFITEPATFEALKNANLILFSDPTGEDEDEPNITGAQLELRTYNRRPMVSVELELPEIDREGCVLLNFSARGYYGAKVKVFWNGELILPAFDVKSTPADRTPNFWVFPEWRSGKNVIDLKFVGNGYLWFDHVDVHHVVI